MKKIILSFKIKVGSITLAKLVSAFITIVIISGVKYGISGEFHLEYSKFFCNVAVGLLGWTVNLSLITWFTDLLSFNGINFNLKQLLFGFHTIENSDLKVEKFKIKMYNAMESDDGSDSGKPLNKGKGIDREQHPYNESFDNLDKGKGVDREQHPFYGSELNRPSAVGNVDTELGSNTNPANEAPFALFRKVFPGVDPASLIHPNRINPGPGFNVPGGEVPIRDEICQYIDYNTHILKQFKTMDLEVAVEQRNNNLTLIRVLEHKLAFAQNALAKIPSVPTTEYEFRLKDKIISDLNDMHNKKVRSEARVTLLNSRIQFIEINIDKKN